MTCSWCGIGIGHGREDETPYSAPADYPGLLACGACYRLFGRMGWRAPRRREAGERGPMGPAAAPLATKRARAERIFRAGELARQGKTQVEIAAALGISRNTVRDYLRAVDNTKKPGEATTAAGL